MTGKGVWAVYIEGYAVLVSGAGAWRCLPLCGVQRSVAHGRAVDVRQRSAQVLPGGSLKERQFTWKQSISSIRAIRLSSS